MPMHNWTMLVSAEWAWFLSSLAETPGSTQPVISISFLCVWSESPVIHPEAMLNVDKLNCYNLSNDSIKLVECFSIHLDESTIINLKPHHCSNNHRQCQHSQGSHHSRSRPRLCRIFSLGRLLCKQTSSPMRQHLPRVGVGGEKE